MRLRLIGTASPTFSLFGTPCSLHAASSSASVTSAARRGIRFTKPAEAGILEAPRKDAHIMIDLDLATRVALFIFGIGGCVALAIVPWACIGTGLYKKDKSYQSY
jgi:hypothetical protein